MSPLAKVVLSQLAELFIVDTERFGLEKVPFIVNDTGSDGQDVLVSVAIN